MNITFDNETPYIWDNPGLKITGCEPLSLVIVDIENYKKDILCHKGQAVFQSDLNGLVDTTVHQSVFGNYIGVDPIGLYWSMEVVNALPVEQWDVDFITYFTATSWQETISTTLTRKVLSDDVSVTPVEIDGVIGEYFLPKNPKSGHVITFGGSGGGLKFGRDFAQFLASNGYPCLAIAYFGLDGIAPILSRIPLEIIGNCIAFIQDQPLYDGNIGICGISRGGELSLLASCYHPEINATIAHSPSGVAWGGMLNETDKASWTLQGKDIPWIAFPFDFEDSSVGPDNLFCATPLFRQMMQDKAAMARAQMPLERIAGDVLLISGDNDNVWCASELCERAVEYFEKKKFSNRVIHLDYESHGHETFNLGLLPTTQTFVKFEDFIYSMGGDPKANAHAIHQTRAALLDFLERAFELG